ncbi:sensor histidine kinase [Humibacter sp.]|uniref:sensor histidine kinase n=1 Tax=Humibacter sp. TaxID=1940291 RepID=UPI003F7D9512
MPHPPWLRTGPDPAPEIRTRRSWRGRVFATALSIFVQLPGLGFAFAGAWHHARGPVDLVSVGSVVLGIAAAALLLLPSRRAGVVAVAALAVPAIALAPGPPTAALAVAIAVARAVLGGAAIWAWCTLAGVGLAGIGWIVAQGGGAAGIRVLAVTVALCVVAAAASGASGRRERFRIAAREEASRRRSAAEEERLRIARELHDVLAHSLSQISVQAGVGLHLFDDDPESARQSLRSIRETSATALDEVRGVLGMLRQSDDSAETSAPRRPEPTLHALPALLEETGRLGLSVEAYGDAATGAWTGDPPVSAATQTAAYRIVQESLTNVRRHAPGALVKVEVGVERDAVTLRVENGPPPSPAAELGAAREERAPGRGILGMRERAAALGGTLEAGPTVAGGFVVTARLPIGPRGAATPREETT